jgi:protein SCO1
MSAAPSARRRLLGPVLALARAQLAGEAAAVGSGAAVLAGAATARAALWSSASAASAFFSCCSSNTAPLLPRLARCTAAATCATASSPAASLRRLLLLQQRGSRRPLHTSRPLRAAAEQQPQPQQAAASPSTSSTPWGQKSPLSFNSMVAGLALFLGIVAVAQTKADKRVGDMMQKSQQVAGKAAVGGPFRLIEHTRGKPFTNRDLLGEFALLYFGFTHCPDICPDELEKVAEAVDAVERTTGAKVVPVFISVDPKRDTPQRVATYVREFHPRMVGLTGTEQAVTDAAKAYRVYFSRTDNGGGGGGGVSNGGGGGAPSSSAAAADDDYLVDHSIITYLIDPAGEFVTFYGKNFTGEQLAESIAGHVMAWAEKDEPYLSRLSCARTPGGGGGGGGGSAGGKEGK